MRHQDGEDDRGDEGPEPPGRRPGAEGKHRNQHDQQVVQDDQTRLDQASKHRRQDQLIQDDGPEHQCDERSEPVWPQAQTNEYETRDDEER